MASGTDPLIAIALVTWPNHPARMDLLRRNLVALRDRLTASRHRLTFVASSETAGVTGATIAECRDLVAEFAGPEGCAFGARDRASDLGANMNGAVALAHAAGADCTLLLQDDFELLQPLDLSDSADFLAAHPEFCAVRYEFPFTRFVGPLGDGFQEADKLGPWLFSDGPHLRPRWFVERIGQYVPGLPHGGQEVEMWHRLRASPYRVAATLEPLFWHAGAGRSTIPERREG